ncbi:MAG: hypothetical protein ACYCTI_03075, partial [Acidimicrobiales bacterium]
LLNELHPDVVHVLARGRIVDTGGPDMATDLERTGYAAYGGDSEEPDGAAGRATAAADPLADPLA